MNKELKKQYRADLFRHLDGIVTAPIAYALYKKGVLSYLIEEKKTTLEALNKAFNGNEGYLNVALHTLASQGWLDYKIEDENTIILSVNEKSSIAFSLSHLYEDVVKLMKLSGKYHSRKFELEPFLLLEKIFQNYKNNYALVDSDNTLRNEVQNQILKHIEGYIVGPTVVALGMTGMFHIYFMEASFRPEEFHKDKDAFSRLLDIFSDLGWFEKKNDTYKFSEKGIFFAKRASAYGVTVSYIPTFREAEELLFGNPRILWDEEEGAREIHVDRKMNVWGSGGAHSAYFKIVDEIIIEIFNQPIEKQPKGIVDLGCGNGAFLIHLYEIIAQRTLRGKLLEEHPLFLVGADYNQDALEVSRENIIQAGIWAKLIWGDIGRPDLLDKSLHDTYGIDLKDLLNVRTFLDHNRIWSEPINSSSNIKVQSQGAFAFRGKRITNIQVENNLKEHLNKWSPYVEKFGLLVIELHTISPELIAQNLGRTAATAYNSTHGFSDQYIVEIDVFNKIAKEVGLMPVKEHFTKFPNSEIATVSINLLKKEV